MKKFQQGAWEVNIWRYVQLHNEWTMEDEALWP